MLLFVYYFYFLFFLWTRISARDSLISLMEIYRYMKKALLSIRYNIENTNEVEVTRKSQRSANFSHQEDICIVSACLNTSKEAIRGGDQTSSRFWKRIYDQFVTNCGQRGRTEQSIKHHWRDINTQCPKFIGCLKTD